MRLVRYSYPSYRSLVPAFGSFARSPWAGLESEIDRLFETALGGLTSSSGSQFAVDLYEDKANTYVRAELPGLHRDEINVEMSDGYLTITAAHKAATPKKGGSKSAESTEETFAFSRAISIADDVQADKVSAVYEHGVLTVTLPKKEVAQPKKIAVAVK